VVETQGWRYRGLGGRDSGVEIQGLGGVVVEFPALSHFNRGSRVQRPIPVGSRNFLTTSTFPCGGGCPMGSKNPATRSG